MFVKKITNSATGWHITGKNWRLTMKRMRRKGERLSIALILSLLIVLLIAISLSDNEVKIPRGLGTSSHATSTPLPPSQVTPVPKATPEPVTILYVVADNISYRWGLFSVIRGWEKARYTQLEIA